MGPLLLQLLEKGNYQKVALYPQNDGESNVAEEESVIYSLKGDLKHEKLIIHWNNESGIIVMFGLVLTNLPCYIGGREEWKKR